MNPIYEKWESCEGVYYEIKIYADSIQENQSDKSAPYLVNPRLTINEQDFTAKLDKSRQLTQGDCVIAARAIIRGRL